MPDEKPKDVTDLEAAMDRVNRATQAAKDLREKLNAAVAECDEAAKEFKRAVRAATK